MAGTDRSETLLHRSTSARCLVCQRFVTPAKCNHYIDVGEYGVVHSTEYECERCAAARPHDQPPVRSAT